MKKIISFTYKLVILLLIVFIYMKVSVPVKQDIKIITKEEKYENL